MLVGLARTVYKYGVHTVLLAGESPNIRSLIVHVHSFGQPYKQEVGGSPWWESRPGCCCTKPAAVFSGTCAERDSTNHADTLASKACVLRRSEFWEGVQRRCCWAVVEHSHKHRAESNPWPLKARPDQDTRPLNFQGWTISQTPGRVQSVTPRSTARSRSQTTKLPHLFLLTNYLPPSLPTYLPEQEDNKICIITEKVDIHYTSHNTHTTHLNTHHTERITHNTSHNIHTTHLNTLHTLHIT